MDYYSHLSNESTPAPCMSDEVLLGKNGSLSTVEIQDLYDQGAIYEHGLPPPQPTETPMPTCRPSAKKHKKSKGNSVWDLKIGGTIVAIVLLMILIGYLSGEPTVPMSI